METGTAVSPVGGRLSIGPIADIRAPAAACDRQRYSPFTCAFVDFGERAALLPRQAPWYEGRAPLRRSNRRV